MKVMFLLYLKRILFLDYDFVIRLYNSFREERSFRYL